MKFLNQFWLDLLLTAYLAVDVFAECSDYTWPCDDGSACIFSDELCDGFKHCKDGSDETAKACIGVRCPSNFFRCSYGACVDSDSECNHVMDCADNSDELSLKCPGVLESYNVKGDCAEGNFMCKESDECIQEDKVCDGKLDCKDKTDETVELCVSYFCPAFGFRCGYGGCIDGTSKCDGNFDCVDKSDESPILCGYKTNITEASEEPTLTPYFGVTGSCLIPSNLPDAIKVFYEANNTKQIRKGSYAEPYSTVVYKCAKRHFLEGNRTNFCFEGKWLNAHSECQKYCSRTAISGVTITTSCELNDATISCMQPPKPQTTAHINCALGYRKPDRSVISLLRCDDEGEWDYHAYRCEQICGEEAPEIVAYVVGGEHVNITKVPWHVGVYSDVIKKDDFSQICGGTIISAKMIISAAHCFWDDAATQFYKPSNFKVAAGKYYRQFNDIEPIQPQIVDVAQILFNREYNHYAGFYALDIVLLTLVDHLVFNSYIKPICLETDLNFNEKIIPPGTIGKVAGWGLEQSGGSSSSELKLIELPAIEYYECKSKLTQELQLFLTSDKFCAGFTTGQSVCQGDSGGGFVYEKKIGAKKLHFLWGIVSTGGNKQGSCDNDKYSLFTNIQSHIQMIVHYESQNRPK